MEFKTFGSITDVGHLKKVLGKYEPSNEQGKDEDRVVKRIPTAQTEYTGGSRLCYFLLLFKQVYWRVPTGILVDASRLVYLLFF